MSTFIRGLLIVGVGLLALLFAYYMNKRWQEPLKGSFLVFIAIAGFVVFFGLYVLLLQPEWWRLPY
ncbi:MAG: hypothetical protein ABIH50_02705 [bacterium]